MLEMMSTTRRSNLTIMYLIISLAIWLSSFLCAKGTEFKLKNATAFESARKTCQDLGATWDLPDDQTHGPELRTFLKQHSVSAVWLPYVKNVYTQWTWKSGAPLAPSQRIHVEAGGNCAGVAVQSMGIVSIPCLEPNVGVICELKGKKDCPPLMNFNCIKFQGNVFVLGCKVDSWYEGQAYCQSLGGTLGNLDSETIVTTVVNLLGFKPFTDKCPWIFAGLRRWEWFKSTSKGDITPEKVGWTHTVEYNKHGHCVVLNSTSSPPKWSNTNCTRTYTTVCQNYINDSLATKPTAVIPPDIQGGQGTSHGERLGWVVLGLSIALILLIAIVLLIIVFRRIRKLPIGGTWPKNVKDVLLSSPSEVQQKNPADHDEVVVRGPLLSQSEQLLFQDQALMVDRAHFERTVATETYTIPVWTPRVTIFMFTSGINEQEPKLKNAYITNIALQANGKGGTHYGTSIAVAATEAFSQLLPRRSTSIINVIADLTSDKSTLLKALKLVKNNITPNSVVFLPTIPKRKESEDNDFFTLVHDLRQRAVVLTQARLMPEFPSSEVITVVGVRDPADCLLVSDFTVTVAEDVPTPQVEQAGAAMAIGVSAAVMYIMRDSLKGGSISTFLLRRTLMDLAMEHDNSISSHLGSLSRLSQTIIPKTVDKALKENMLLNEMEIKGKHLGSSHVPKGKDDFKNSQILKGGIRVAMITYRSASGRLEPPWSKIKKWQINRIDTMGVKQNKVKMDKYPEGLPRFLEELDKILPDAKHNITCDVYLLETKDVNIWDRIQDALDDVVLHRYHVVHLKSFPDEVPTGHPVLKTTAKVRASCVLMTNALPMSRDRYVPQYPCMQAIAITSEDKFSKDIEGNELKGAALDFTSKGEAQKGDIVLKASYTATALVLAILSEALHNLGLGENAVTSLSRTAVMQRILREMSSHPREHHIQDGWGSLDTEVARKKLQTQHDLRQLCNMAGKSYWNVKICHMLAVASSVRHKSRPGLMFESKPLPWEAARRRCEQEGPGWQIAQLDRSGTKYAPFLTLDEQNKLWTGLRLRTFDRFLAEDQTVTGKPENSSESLKCIGYVKSTHKMTSSPTSCTTKGIQPVCRKSECSNQGYPSVVHNGQCYFWRSSMTWPAAHAWCRGQRGQLVGEEDQTALMTPGVPRWIWSKYTKKHWLYYKVQNESMHDPQQCWNTFTTSATSVGSCAIFIIAPGTGKTNMLSTEDCGLQHPFLCEHDVAGKDLQTARPTEPSAGSRSSRRMLWIIIIASACSVCLIVVCYIAVVVYIKKSRQRANTSADTYAGCSDGGLEAVHNTFPTNTYPHRARRNNYEDDGLGTLYKVSSPLYPLQASQEEGTESVSSVVYDELYPAYDL